MKKSIAIETRQYTFDSKQTAQRQSAINKYIHTMNHILTEIHDLLAFQIKQASRHNLEEIRISVPRAKELCTTIRIAKHDLKMKAAK